MSFQLPRTLLSKLARPAVRVAGRNVGRRAMSSHPAGAKKSDTPWIIGSALIFGPAAVYLLTPPAQEKVHEAKDAGLPKHKIPDPARAPVPAGTDENVGDGVPDDEGNKVSASEYKYSTDKAAEEDAPKTAEYAEAETSKRAQPETNEAAKDTPDYDPNVAAHADTEGKEDTGALETSKKRPRDIGGARERAKSGLDPSTSADVDEAVGEEDKKDEEKKKTEEH